MTARARGRPSRPAARAPGSTASVPGLLLALAACAHPPAPRPAPSAYLRPLCTAAAVVPSDEPHPVRVEVDNRTGHDIRIVLDRCLRLTLVGVVAADRTASLRLPDRLLRFGDGLRFHAFTQSPNAWYGAFQSDFDVPVAHLTVSEEAARARLQQPDSLTGVRAVVGSIVEHADDRLARVSVFSSESYAVLTWQCRGGKPELTFASGGRLHADPTLTLDVGHIERSFGRWSLVRAFTDGAVAPDAVIAPFTAATRGARVLTLGVRDGPGDGVRYVFDARGLDEALRRLSCLR